MRRYLLTAFGADKLVRIERVKASVAKAERDPIAQKTVLHLESAPVFTKQLNKGKGIVFDFDINSSGDQLPMESSHKDKLRHQILRQERERVLSQG
ncbi:hypothetical protein IGI04_022633 [Brassica rapa subsp. trilocularis]|uniref:Uncharacterized protein n=1 Tax=Brassica rapa subsp. trilocularis TaxID=1813537 RepID=A0ABQ7M1I0_BRACM|nr:hypothetical protein IGI04_022633 [Brassica rapa subsp. trilocularis]